MGGGGAPVKNGVTDVFLQNTSCIRKPQVISWGGGGCTSKEWRN